MQCSQTPVTPTTPNQIDAMRKEISTRNRELNNKDHHMKCFNNTLSDLARYLTQFDVTYLFFIDFV